MNRIYLQLLLVVSIVSAVLTSCGEAMEWNDTTTTNGAPDVQRQTVMHEVTVSIDDAATRVAYTPDNNIQDNNNPTNNTPGLRLSWENNETLGVYIKKTDNSIVYAGTVSYTGGTAGYGVREFRGTVSKLNNGEQYIYMHPAVSDETVGSAAAGKIDYTSQTGELGSTAHLKQFVPLVWRDNGEPILTAEKQAYVVRVLLQFNEDPGKITSVALRTMKMGDDGTTPDKIFPKYFNTANLANGVNNTLATEKTAGTTLSGDAAYTDEITLGISSSVPKKVGTMWKADAYIAVPSINNLDVFRTKYDVKVIAEKGTYYSDYRSFPEQGSTTAATGLPMLTDGKCYNLRANMSKSYAMTIISEQFRVNSLLGMWNTYGKPCDPCNLIYDGSNYTLPTHVADIIGDEAKQTTLMSRMLEGRSSQGTPTFTYSFTDACNITIKEEASEVYVTFLSEFAWSQNLLGYYHYTKLPDNADAAKKNIIFANMSKGGHVPYNKNGEDGGKWVNPNETTNPGQNVGNIEDAPLKNFTTVKLIYTDENGFSSTKFPVGTTIGFFMMQDPKASTIEYDSEGNVNKTYSPRDDGTLLNWNSYKYFTNTAWNTSNDIVFKSGNLAIDETTQSGIAIYGARDNVSNNANYAYSAMLFMVSTEKPAAMSTTNTTALNLGTGEQIITP